MCNACVPATFFRPLKYIYLYLFYFLQVSVFDLGAGGIRLMAQGHGHSETVTALQWSPDEKQVVSVGEDCCVCVWNFYGTA